MTTEASAVSIKKVVRVIERPSWKETIELSILLILFLVVLAGLSLGVRMLAIALRDLLMMSGGG